MLRRDDVSLALFDIDHLREIDSQFSHHAADAAIRKLAEVVAATAPDGSKAFRVGGDEMGLVMSLSGGAASQVAERVRERYEAADQLAYDFMEFSRGPLNDFTCSAGIGSAPRGGGAEAVRHLQESAWRALAEAKELGRNRVCSSYVPTTVVLRGRG